MAVLAQNISSQDASSIIDSALFDAQTGGKAITGPSESGLQPGPLPTSTPVDTEKATPLTADEKKIRDAQIAMSGQEQVEQQEKEEAEQEAKDATLLGAAEKLLASGKQKASTVNVKIGNVPTPGSIMVPLILLLIFFFILVQFGGNTRLQWLWLVLTNNAYITASQQSTTPATTPTTQTSPTTLTLPTQPTLPIIPVPIIPLGGNPFS